MAHHALSVCLVPTWPLCRGHPRVATVIGAGLPACAGYPSAAPFVMGGQPKILGVGRAQARPSSLEGSRATETDAACFRSATEGGAGAEAAN